MAVTKTKKSAPKKAAPQKSAVKEAPAKKTAAKEKPAVKAKRAEPAKKTPAAKPSLILAGRGLGALLARQNVALPPQNSENALLSDIEPDPAQPRKLFDEAALAEMAETIKAHGLIQPIVVTPAPAKSKKKYRIVAGERRYQACLKAGLKEAPVRVVRGDAGALSEIALTENLQREHLSPIETAAAIKQFIEAQHLTQEKAAARLGLGRAALANKLRLLTMPENLKTALHEGRLSEGHAKVLLTVRHNEKKMLKLADDCMRLGWTVRVLAEKAAGKKTAPEKSREEAWKPKGGAKLVKKLGFDVLAFAQGDVNRLELNGLTKEQAQKICDLLDRESEKLAVKAPAAKAKKAKR